MLPTKMIWIPDFLDKAHNFNVKRRVPKDAPQLNFFPIFLFIIIDFQYVYIEQQKVYNVTSNHLRAVTKVFRPLRTYQRN